MNYKIEPFSDNIVFWDTEFSGNNSYVAELLSIGMVKMSGEELYLELEYEQELDSWVLENVVPYLNQEKISPKVALLQIENFVGKSKPNLISFISPFDFVYFTKLLGRDEINRLFQWPPIDFASVLFGNNIDPLTYYSTNKDNFFSEIGVNVAKYKLHNALDDAKLLREVYLKLIK